MVFLRRTRIRIILYLDGMLILAQAQTKKELMNHRDTVVFFTPVTGFCEKSKEIFDVTSSGDRIRPDDNNFKGNDNSPHSRKIAYKKVDVSKPS